MSVSVKNVLSNNAPSLVESASHPRTFKSSAALKLSSDEVGRSPLIESIEPSQAISTFLLTPGTDDNISLSMTSLVYALGMALVCTPGT